VIDDHGQGLVPRLARWELDLALIYEHEALPEPDVELERTRLLEDPFDLVVPDGHPLAGRASVAFEELADETWIGGARTAPMAPSSPTAAERPASTRVSPSAATTTTGVQAFVAVGLGVAVLPHLALVFARPGLHRVRLAVPPTRTVTAARLAGQLPVRRHGVDAHHPEGNSGRRSRPAAVTRITSNG
jgi:DNA-binding transcriptional LysR family regulator